VPPRHPSPAASRCTPERAVAPAVTSGAEAPLTNGSWWPGIAWLLGTAACAGRAVGGRLLLIALRLRCRVIREGAVVHRVAGLAPRVGWRRAPGVLQAAGATGPAALGVWRPAVIVPAGFAEDFPPAQQEAVLAHELAHLAARDPAWH